MHLFIHAWKSCIRKFAVIVLLRLLASESKPSVVGDTACQIVRVYRSHLLIIITQAGVSCQDTRHLKCVCANLVPSWETQTGCTRDTCLHQQALV